MRLSKFLGLTFFITFVALVYVYQQSEIFYLAYTGGKKQVILTGLLDKNNILRYNINRSSSLAALDGKILRNIDFELPSAQQLVRLNVEEYGNKAPSVSKNKANLILSFFGRAKQAQAETINRLPLR